MAVARVIVDLSLDRVFDYLIPENLESEIRPGVQVDIPFGKSKKTRRGYVLSVKSDSDYPKLKKIAAISDKYPSIPSKLVKLGEWMADYYCSTREQAVRTLLPGAVRSGRIRKKKMLFYSLSNREKAEIYIAEKARKAPKQLEVLKVLLVEKSLPLSAVKKLTGNNNPPLNPLVKKKLILKSQKTVLRNPFDDFEILRDKIKKPSDEQKKALTKFFDMLKAIEKSEQNNTSTQRAMLLHGVTGSGKTEIYLQAISEILKKGKESIVLVPEISLTPQTVERFRSRFGNMVSVLHSGLSEGERYDEWMKIHQGNVKIVVGARSALFAPFEKLGLIIVDEEHENSYKQSEAPRYNARDVAVMRGTMENAAVILGSATPSFESYHNAVNGKYEYAELTKRIDNFLMPEMRVTDMRLEKYDDSKEAQSFFSKDLVNSVYDRLSKSEQTIIFLNRRGFNLKMSCENCGFEAKCSECSVNYTYHRYRELLICHMCGDVKKAYLKCPECGSEDIRKSGIGTERVEDIMSRLFPGAKVARMDSDTMTRKKSYEKTLSEVKKGNIDILIGTQMIAKGLHFPNITLVGIINADQGLFMEDFRAEERTFQLLTQVAGRAGRGDIKGEVIIQTRNPFHPSIQYAVNHDYKGFYEEDFEIRESLLYPPASRLIAVYVRSTYDENAANFAELIFKTVKPYLNENIKFCPPAPAPIERIKGKYRYMMSFRGKKMKILRKVLRKIVLSSKKPKNIDVFIDVDALSLM